MNKKSVLKCDLCNTDIYENENYFSILISEEKITQADEILKLDEYPLHTICKKCAHVTLLKNISLLGNNKVSINVLGNE